MRSGTSPISGRPEGGLAMSATDELGTGPGELLTDGTRRAQPARSRDPTRSRVLAFLDALYDRISRDRHEKANNDGRCGSAGGTTGRLSGVA